MKIYLAGSIPKGNKERENFVNWRDEFREKLSGIEGIEFLDPDFSKNFEDEMEIVGGDLNLVKNSNIIIVYSPKRLGVGTSQEMVIAKYFSNAVITVIPKETHHRRASVTYEDKTIEDWIHPFVKVFSDHIVETVEESIEWIEEYSKDPSSKKIKDISIIDESIDYFNNLEKN